MADRVVDLVDDELHQRTVESHLEHGNHCAEHGQWGLVGVLVQPVDDEFDVDVRLRDLVVLEHPPPAHQREFGVGVLLFLSMKVAVDVSEGLGRGLARHGRETAGTDVLDPHQIRHERLEFGVQFRADQLRARCVPVDVGEGPLTVLDLVQHGIEIEVRCHRHFPVVETD